MISLVKDVEIPNATEIGYLSDYVKEAFPMGVERCCWKDWGDCFEGWLSG